MSFFADIFRFLHDLTQLLHRIENIYYLLYWWNLLLLFCFLSNQENLYMIHHDLNITEDKLTTVLWFQIILISIFKWIKKFFHNFIYFIINHDFHVIIFEYITRSSSLFMEEIKLFAIVNWIIYVSGFWDYLWCLLNMV